MFPISKWLDESLTSNFQLFQILPYDQNQKDHMHVFSDVYSSLWRLWDSLLIKRLPKQVLPPITSRLFPNIFKKPSLVFPSITVFRGQLNSKYKKIKAFQIIINLQNNLEIIEQINLIFIYRSKKTKEEMDE